MKNRFSLFNLLVCKDQVKHKFYPKIIPVTGKIHAN